GGEIVGFVGEDFEITRNTTAVPHVREARCVLRGSNQEFLLLAKLLGFAIRHQRIRNVPEGPLNCLLIAEEELLLPSLCLAYVRSQLPCSAARVGERSATVRHSRALSEWT